jgi:hypothetical protein
MTAWTVKLDNRVRPIVESIAREEQREPAQVVRRLVDAALAQRALAQRPIPAPIAPTSEQANR